MTRPRWGTSVNVVRPLRWLHSLVTDRVAMIGRMTAIGMPKAAPNVPYAIWSFGAKRITAVVASSAAMPMLAISQKPERVSNILRSSVVSSRWVGIALAPRCGRSWSGMR